MTQHDLKHTAASLAVSAGANVKALQRMLGHKSAAMTLDIYADLLKMTSAQSLIASTNGFCRKAGGACGPSDGHVARTRRSHQFVMDEGSF
ncbi:tyrosine-type recombinase/integrase [Leifsonia shinshuensis]|uniref:Tyrosine-type recombinase/integrase n=1 Tax=Leifsonia shinshuensis TaxID=150026 RepID=A0A7G6YFP6_9MICO|nr:tyrosine-type recombinase/integrase [Leifsonia shinshuensis]QNE37311.1 tyrosine-type recombinase/integrase [Leifsonia shinshuensis]